MSNTLRFDWASASVILFAFVLPVVLSWSVNHWWTTRERKQQLAAQQEGVVFAIPPLFRAPLLFVLFALAAISLFLLIAAFNGPQTGITVEAGLGISLLFAPLIAGSLIVLLRNTGMVVLTAEGVSLRRAGHTRFLHYEDIVELKSQAHIPASVLLLRGMGQTLRIPRTIEQLPRLYEILIKRLPSAVRDAVLRKPDIFHEEHLARDLQNVTLTSSPILARAQVDSITVEQEMTRHILILEFAGDNRLTIDQTRAAQFGESLERLYVMTKELYE